MEQNSFTLTELLLIVVIIGTLVTIMYPNFEGFIIRARLKELYHTVELIRQGEKYYFFRTGNWVGFAKNEYATNPELKIEEHLAIKIPKGRHAFCEYQASYEPGPPSYFKVDAYSKNASPPEWNNQILYYWRRNDDGSEQTLKNPDHPWGKYLK